MKKLLLAATALVVLGSAAYAGPNAGGSLIASTNPSVVYTTDTSNYCGSSGLQVCEGAIPQTPGSDVAVVNIIAAFNPSANPRLSAVAFGWVYPAEVTILAYGPCGDFELATGGWPASGEGTAVTFSVVRLTSLTEVYWAAAYNYYGSDVPGSLCLAPHPSQGATFADDSVPAQLDPIAQLGCFGFGQPGNAPCPTIVVHTGACCLPNFGGCVVVTADECALAGGDYQGDDVPCNSDTCPTAPRLGACCVGTTCIVTTADDCGAQGGSYQGDDVPCNSDTCQPIPTKNMTWGSIKKTAR